MLTNAFQKTVACILALLLMLPLLCLPALAAPPVADRFMNNAIDHSGNVGDTDGDGSIEQHGSETGLIDEILPHDGQKARDGSRDPAEVIGDTAEQVEQAASGNWIIAVICIAAVIALILIIVALIPGKRTK